MFNRNLIWLWRNTYTIGSGCHRLDPKRPNFFGPCHYTNKNTPPKDNHDGKGEKGSCEPCQNEAVVPEEECGCETPISRFPIFPECEEGCSKPIPKSAAASPSAVCPPPNQGPPCEPVCSELKKPVVCPPKSGIVNCLRMISLLVVLPVIVGLTAFVFMTREEVHRPPFVPYPFMRIHNNVRKYPWNSDKTFFYNSRVNALADGYEFEEEGEASLTEKTDESAEANDGEGEQVNDEDKENINEVD